MNITISIERLILDGVPVPRRYRPQLQAAIEEELARLLAVDGMAAHLQSGGVLSRVSGGEVQLQGKDDPVQLGRQIAQAVYRGIGQ
jgi:hypothetical protein